MLHTWKGFRNSPKGDRIVGSVMAVRRGAPTVGGSFAMWGGLFSAFDCALAAYRHTEDIYNPIASGFLTGAVLASRGGLKSSMRAGVFGGVLLALIEGAAHLLQKVMEQQQHQQLYGPPQPAPARTLRSARTSKSTESSTGEPEKAETAPTRGWTLAGPVKPGCKGGDRVCSDNQRGLA